MTGKVALKMVGVLPWATLLFRALLYESTKYFPYTIGKGHSCQQNIKQLAKDLDAMSSTTTLNVKPKSTEAKTKKLQDVPDVPLARNCTVYADGIIQGLMPYITCMNSIFRFPLHIKKDLDGSYLFYSSLTSITGLGFTVTSFFFGILTPFFILNVMGSNIEFPPIQDFSDTRRLNIFWGNHRYEERYIYRRNGICIILIITNLLQITVTSWNIFTKRHFAASYFTFWTKAVEELQIDAAFGLKRYVVFLMINYVGFCILFTTLCLMRFAPVATGGPAVLTMLSVRCFYPAIHTLDSFWIYRGFGGVILIYIMIGSKTFMLLFLILCRLMRNSFLVWNHRLDRVLHRGEGKNSRSKKLEDRTGFDHLFKDHVCLLDLLEGADMLLANIIESYYATQTFSIIFEVYYLYKSQTSEEDFAGIRRLDGVIIFLYLAHSLVFLFAISKAASEVGEEAVEGLEILRRKSMMGDKTPDELYFTISMYNSYNGDFETALTGGRYFVLDKGLLTAILGTIFSYFIILSQFSPSLITTKNIDQLSETYQNERLLERVEGTYQYARLSKFY